MISVCLVDDQTLVRQGIRSLLELSPEIEVVAECSDGVAALEKIPEIKPDVVLLDMRMPGKSGLDVLNEFSAHGAVPPTIILTTFDDDQLVLAGLKAGARGYLLKDVSLEQLVDAVKTVAAGGSLIGVRLSHWRSDGGPKTRFRDQVEAERAALQARLEHGTELVTYQCEFCGGWHLGTAEQ